MKAAQNGVGPGGLPDAANPFRRMTVYRQLEVDPFASETEVAARVNTLSESFSSLSDDEKMAKLSSLQDGLKALRDDVQRLRLNVFEIARLRRQDLAERVRRLDTVPLDQVELPELGIDHVLVEGHCASFAAADFRVLAPDASLELDASLLSAGLATRIPQPGTQFDT